MAVDVLYWDNHLLILNKPALMVTQPTEGHPTSLELLGKQWLQNKFHKERAFLEAAHRLDREVTGIVLFARTSKALSRLQEMQRSNQFTKIYHALLEGEWQGEKASEMVDYLLHGDYKAQVVSSKVEGAKYARLEYSVLAKKKDKTYLEIRLNTGRYHQIRIQCASRGYPVLGDKKYGSQGPYAPGIALHHYRLSFPHPVQEKLVEVEAPLPAAFLAISP